MRALRPLFLALVIVSCTTSGETFDPPTDPTVDPPFELSDPIEVLRVHDGDTIVIELNNTSGTFERGLRFKGIDTPELNPDPPGSPPQPFAEDARDFVLSNIGSRIDIEFDSSCPASAQGPCLNSTNSADCPEVTCSDSFDRLLAYVRMATGDDLGAVLLSAGLARVFAFQNEQFDRRSEYQALEADARNRGVGLWSQ